MYGVFGTYSNIFELSRYLTLKEAKIDRNIAKLIALKFPLTAI